MMHRLMVATERILHDRSTETPPAPAIAAIHPVSAAIVYGAARIAAQLFARLVVVVTRTGATARVKAKHRDFTPAIGLSQSEETLRRMSLFWGITPLPGAPIGDPPKLRRFVVDWGREEGLLSPGDRVVFVTGTGLVEGAYNLVVVHEVERG